MLNLSQILGLVPAKYRLTLYILASAALIVYAGWQTHDHDWQATIGALVLALLHALAAGNVDTSAPATEPPADE